MRTASGRYRRPSSDGYWTTSRSTATDWPWCSCSPGACTRWNPARPRRRPVIHKLSSPSTPRRRRAPRRAIRRRRRRTISRCATGWQHRPRTGIFARGNARTDYVQFELSSGRQMCRPRGNQSPYAAAHFRVGARHRAISLGAEEGMRSRLKQRSSGRTAAVGNKLPHRIVIGAVATNSALGIVPPSEHTDGALQEQQTRLARHKYCQCRSQVFPAAQLAQPALPQLEHATQARRPGWASASSIKHPLGEE